MIGNEVSRWVLSALFAGLGAWYLAAAGRELFPLGRRRRLVPAVGAGLQAVMCAVMIASDGSTVSWDEKSANGAVPHHPAPVLQLAAAASAHAVLVSSTPVDSSRVNTEPAQVRLTFDEPPHRGRLAVGHQRRGRPAAGGVDAHPRRCPRPGRRVRHLRQLPGLVTG